MTSHDYAAIHTAGVLNGGVSHWFASTGMPRPGAPLEGDVDVDVCIVGAGMTGLWTAYYLRQADPALRIVVLEAEFAGFGASGRNGGWLSSALMGSRAQYRKGPRGDEGVDALEAEMRDTVDEVIRVAEAEGIDADIVKSGVLTVARSPAQLVRLRADRAARPTASSTVELSAEEASARVAVAGTIGGVFNPDCARIHPAKLVSGLAGRVRAMGVTIHEQTRVVSIEPGRAVTERGVVKAPHVLRCTEGFTASLKGSRREWLPMNSAMIVTDPIPGATWDEIGWSGSELLGDNAYAYFYAQRTADDRIAIGGRGIPYRFGSRTDIGGRTQGWTIESLRGLLDSAFPQLRATDVEVERAWCGVLGVPRDWCATVGLDQSSGLGWAGGYVGHGVAATNLAGRTLRDLVLGSDSDLVAHPWVERRVRRWEPEPIRWLGVKAMYGLYRSADRREDAGITSPSRLGRLGDALSGR